MGQQTMGLEREPVARQGVPIPRRERRLVAWVRARQPSKVHVETSRGSGRLLCGFRVPPEVDEVIRGARQLDDRDPHWPSCIVCSDTVTGWAK